MFAGKRPDRCQSPGAVEHLPASGTKRAETRARGQAPTRRTLRRSRNRTARGAQPIARCTRRRSRSRSRGWRCPDAERESPSKCVGGPSRVRPGVPAIAPTSAPVATWSDTITATSCAAGARPAPSKQDRGRHDSHEHVERRRPDARHGLNAARGCGDAPCRKRVVGEGNPDVRALARLRRVRDQAARGEQLAPDEPRFCAYRSARERRMRGLRRPRPRRCRHLSR